MREKRMQIISEIDIDETSARAHISTERDIELLPAVPEKLTVSDAAGVLSVSEPTIIRMIDEGQIQLEKSAILDYIEQNYLANRPLNLTQNAPDCPK